MPRARPGLMKVFAHRGWAMGDIENSLTAFQMAAEHPKVDGVEFDVRKGTDGQLVVIHDPPQLQDTPPLLDDVLEFLSTTALELLIEIKQPDIGEGVVAALEKHNLLKRAIVFGFPAAAASLPFNKKRTTRLGIIVHLPWQARRLIQQHGPDVVLTGWDKRQWVRRTCRVWWALQSLRKLSRRANAPLVLGTVRYRRDLDWLSRQGVDMVTADLDTPQLQAWLQESDGPANNR